MKSIAILFYFILIPLFNLAQIIYNDNGEMMSFAYNSDKVKALNDVNKIATIYLDYPNKDSIFWRKNLNGLVPGFYKNTQRTHIEIGVEIDTSFNFFELATKIKIKEGYIWLLKINCPNALTIGTQFDKLKLNKNSYLGVYTELMGCKNCPYSDTEAEIKTQTFSDKYENFNLECQSCGPAFDGTELYIEYFSLKNEEVKNGFNLEKISLFFKSSINIDNYAPEWVKKEFKKYYSNPN